jgi:hypothetical protein
MFVRTGLTIVFVRSFSTCPLLSVPRSLLMCIFGTILLSFGASAHALAAPKTSAQSPSGPSTSVAQTYTIDAGSLVNALTVTATASAGDIEITIKNLLPATITTYSLTIDVFQTQALPAVLPSPGSNATVGGAPSCDDLIKLYQSHLTQAISEQDVAYVGIEFNSLANSASSPCTSAADKASLQTAITDYQNATTATLANKISLAAGERVVLTLKRNAAGRIQAKDLGT